MILNKVTKIQIHTIEIIQMNKEDHIFGKK